VNLTYFLFFLAILFGTLIITYWASQREKTTRQFYVMSSGLTGMQNGLAIAGDFISAASFLGVTGSIALNGFDGFIYALGFLGSFLPLFFLIAEPVRNLGQYTIGDVIYFRFPEARIRLLTSMSTMLVSMLYMIPQLVAAGLVIRFLLHVPYHLSVLIIGTLMVIYVVFGGMMATSWIQIVKTILLLSGAFLMVLILLSRFHWNVLAIVEQIPEKSPLSDRFFRPGQLFAHPVDALSLHLSLIAGTAALPHILVRFYTVKDRLAVRQSVLASIWLIGLFYLMTLILGFGVVLLVGTSPLVAMDPSGNLAAPLLADALGGDFFAAFISAVAFATVLAVVTGLVVTATTSFAHDIYNHFLKKGKATEPQQLKAAKMAALIIGTFAIGLSLCMQNMNATFLVSLTFSVAAAMHLPLLILTLYWKRFNSTGAVSGMIAGFAASFICVLLGPAVMDPDHGLIPHPAIVPLEYPGILSIPAAFLAAAAGAWLSKPHSDDARFRLLRFQSHTGIRLEPKDF